MWLKITTTLMRIYEQNRSLHNWPSHYHPLVSAPHGFRCHESWSLSTFNYKPFRVSFFLLVSLQFSSLLTLPLNFLYFNSSFSLVQFHFMFASFFFLFFVVFRSIHNEYTLKTQNPLDPCAWDRAKGIKKQRTHKHIYFKLNKKTIFDTVNYFWVLCFTGEIQPKRKKR